MPAWKCLWVGSRKAIVARGGTRHYGQLYRGRLNGAGSWPSYPYIIGGDGGVMGSTCLNSLVACWQAEMHWLWSACQAFKIEVFEAR